MDWKENAGENPANRNYAKGMPLNVAVDRAVDECIRQGPVEAGFYFTAFRE